MSIRLRMIKPFSVGMFFLIFLLPQVSFSADQRTGHPVETLVGEHLLYDISFLWFEHLAEGSIRLEKGEKDGTYLAVMEAKTLGFAAFVTRQREEKHQTLMEIGPGGLLRPLRHSSHTFKGKGDKKKEKRVSYDYDHDAREVHYKRVRDGRVSKDELVALSGDGPVFDFVSAFYNLRLGLYGLLKNERKLYVPTFYRKEIEEIVIEPLTRPEKGDKKFFSKQGQVCKVLLDPSVFKTKGRDVYISIDDQNRLDRGIIKNVIGLGDVKGVLRQLPNLARSDD
ncbi:Protein of unknown function [Malonomonas rubra DSM 5091]|uniref:DUF3108 domain-containing protein n=1 Tax=Malonomonas rubra DSM 5091 TaxID=1122189 RepID=A0A1M6B9Y1_MALRU|nr:DUF3108 domain-containing protein [Malonomonas rubra]SHI45541.1 Protein of unknown function [Malonomonas rubra DSM 5091]